MSDNLPSSIGKSCNFYNGEVQGKIVDEICFEQHNNEEKAVSMQKIEYSKGNVKSPEFRIGYYKTVKNEWKFQSYHLLIQPKDFEKLITAAKKKGWIKN